MQSMADLPALHPERVRPLRRAEYERLVDLGSFADERIELLHGALVTMSPQGGVHSSTVARLGKRLTIALGDRAEVRQHRSTGSSI
jgi:Uma2 family endonuclease